jgi:hypothetical protein
MNGTIRAALSLYRSDDETETYLAGLLVLVTIGLLVYRRRYQ